MSLRRLALNIAAWLAVFGFWVFLARDYHPTLLIDALATAVLVTVAAGTVYVNKLILLPKYRARRAYALYAIALVATVVLLALIAVITIQLMYDALWGPDPRRFGFGTNFVYECIFIVVHFVAALGVMKLAGLLRRRPPPAVKE